LDLPPYILYDFSSLQSIRKDWHIQKTFRTMQRIFHQATTSMKM